MIHQKREEVGRDIQVNSRRRAGRRNAGFTLVEMIVVLTIMAIMMSAAVWGVTGWISHYTYISCEEKARTIYMGAQSALSAAESRGTLDEYMEALRSRMEADGTIFAQTTGGAGLDKITYGIIKSNVNESGQVTYDYLDNEGVEHEYGYLAVKLGDYKALAQAGGSHPLFTMLNTYVSDAEQLNGSIVIEFDLTAKKVYSAFYSDWATSILYAETESEVRGAFYITAAHREPSYREDYAVGYYAADQVNVVQLDDMQELNVDECMLHNEEELYLTVSSTSLLEDNDTTFDIELYGRTRAAAAGGGGFSMFGAGASDDSYTDTMLCSFSISRQMLSGSRENIPRQVQIEVMDASGNSMGTYPFILSFIHNRDESGATTYHALSVVLDAVSTNQSMELMQPVDAKGRTDRVGHSITRLLGIQPMDILAKVTVKAGSSVIPYAEGPALQSNVENDLFAYKDDGSAHKSDDKVYEIARCRHLSNIRYVEDYPGVNGTEHTYVMTGSIDWADGVIYDAFSGSERPDGSNEQQAGTNTEYRSLDTSVIGFPMITRLNEKSVFDGDGKQIANLLLTNESGTRYERDASANLVGTDNSASVLGLFGTNQGTIRRVMFSGARVEAYSAANYVSSGKGSTATAAIYNDSLEAVGIACGRSAGYIRELYFDKDCSVYADVFVNLDDADEAKADGIDNPEAEPHLNQIYGCGVGMVAGTVAMNEQTVFDRIRTSGTVTGTIGNTKETPEVSDIAARAEIYNDETRDAEGRTNADYYTYGVGGVFGYAYGTYVGTVKQLGIGISREDVTQNLARTTDEEGGYKLMCGKTLSEEIVTDAHGAQVTIHKYEDDPDIELFADWTEQSIVNKADVTGEAFTGGIVGNVCVDGLRSNKRQLYDGENDLKIPDNAVPQLVNCHNYGDTVGTDFVGGVVGVNGEGGYIAECVSYGSPSAKKGVSAGITSENYGYIGECRIDRAGADTDNNDQPYVPKIDGNMVVAGAVTSVNHEGCVVSDCECAVTKIEGIADKIIIAGKDMDTFGFLVGTNDGVVNGGTVGAYLGYDSPKTRLTIGGAVGINNLVVKNVTVVFDLVDTSQADCIGGIAGENLDVVKNCRFGGYINKTVKNFAGLAVGGIVAKNGDGTAEASVKNCYLIGAGIEVSGICNFVETNTEAQKLAASSAVGGVCGYNYAGSTITNCYVTSLSDGEGGIEKQSTLTVNNGMAGGIVAANLGTVTDCGYTDKVFVENVEEKELLVVTEATKNVSNMSFMAQVKPYLDRVSSDVETLDANGYSVSQNAVKELNNLFMDAQTGILTKDVRKMCGFLDAPGYDPETGVCIYALPKHPYDEGDRHVDAYDASGNHYIVSMNKGKGYIGGIAGYNAAGGEVTGCASGKWVVENYLTTAKYSAIGGVIGENAADGNRVNYNMNFAYVRNELQAVPETDEKGSVINEYGQMNRNDEKYNRNFYYVGGVVGTQSNTTNGNWTIEKCINAGTVLNYYGNNAGGVVCKIKGNGGNVQYCYNYGMLMTGYTTTLNSGYSGTAGGIISHYTDLEPDQVNNVLHCQNHGVISFPMQGLDYDTNYRINHLGGMAANDVGGVVGEISAPQSKNLYTVNIMDCVNGVNARVYAYSTDSGILGKVGCYSKDGIVIKTSVNSIFVNLDNCRNYSSQIWNFQDVRTDNRLISQNSAGIISGREGYDASVDKIGYTTVQNCLSMRLMSILENGNLPSLNGSKVGKIADFKINTFQQNYESYRYCSNNYYVDDISFQYNTKQGRIQPDGFVEGSTGTNAGGNYLTMVNAFVSDGKPDSLSDAVIPVVYADTEKQTKEQQIANANYIDELSYRLDAARIVAVAYGDSRTSYAFVPIDYKYDKKTLNKNNTWVEGDNLYIYTTEEVVACPILYKFAETGNAAPYNKKLLGHFYFDRVKKLSQYKEAAEQEFGMDLTEKASASRLPFADEYDIDYFALDCAYVNYIKAYKEELKPDKVENVSVDKNPYVGNYRVTWDVRPGEGSSEATAKEFDVEIRYYSVPKGTEIEVDEDSLASYTLEMTDTKTAYGNTTTFTAPTELERKEELDYYAVVRVKDSRAGEQFFSEVLDGKVITDSDTGEEKTIYSYIKLAPKLPTPVFEIVSYKKKWMLHLKNADDFAAYVDLENFELGTYALNSKSEIDTNKQVKMTADNILIGAKDNPDAPLLANAVDASRYALGTMNYELYGYAKAKDCLDADLYKFTIYVPKKAVPNMNYSLTANENGDHLNDGNHKPEFNGELSYTQFDTETQKINNVNTEVVVASPTAQIFRVEMYGVKTGTDAEGKEITWHETVAMKEYSLAVGQKTDVIIGYYDVPSSVKLSEYDEFGIECWYAASGQGDVYNYFETTENWAAYKTRETGFITDRSDVQTEYFFKSAKLQRPEFEVIAYNGSWQLHLKNAEAYKNVVGAEGFYIEVSRSTNWNQRTNLTKSNFVATLGGDAVEELLNNRKDGSGFAYGEQDITLVAIAKANEYYDSERYEFTVYMPKKISNNNNLVNPDIDYELIPKEDGDRLNTDDHAYKGTLIYRAFDRVDNTVPPIAQIFRVELYGLKRGVDESGNEITWHETVARKDYSLQLTTDDEGNVQPASCDVEISTADAPDSLDLSEYESFAIDCWYASPGQGDVYNYFEVDKEKAERKLRSTNYITDVSSGVMKYYYHPFFKKPEIEFVCIDRGNSWYARLLNQEVYAGSGAKICVRMNNTTYRISTDEPIMLNGIPQYAIRIGNWTNATCTCWVEASPNLPTRTANYNASGQKVTLRGDNLAKNTYVDLSVDYDTYKETEESEEVTGTFTIDADNNLKFRGTLHYDSHADTASADNNIGQYYRYELYAYDEKGQEVTLYISEDQLMQPGWDSTQNSYQHTAPIAIDINSGDGRLDITKYHDFHVAVWYSKANINAGTEDAEAGLFFYQYYEIPENIAKSLACYDAQQDSFVDARANGLLIDISAGENKPKYYYVAPLYDNARYANTTKKFNGYVLYCEAKETISKINLSQDNVVGTNVTWSINDSAAASRYHVEICYYNYDGGEVVTPELLNGLTPLTEASDVDLDTNTLSVVTPEIEGYTFDYDAHSYYALIRVRDAKSESKDSYSNYCVVKMMRDLATPDISLLRMNNKWVVRLNNPEDFPDLSDTKLNIHMTSTGLDANFTLDLSDETWATPDVEIPYTWVIDSNKYKKTTKDGKSAHITAYAETSLQKSRNSFEADALYPYWNARQSYASKITVTGASFDKSALEYKAQLTYTCDAQYQSEFSQRFTIGIVGKSRSDGRYAVLTRTDHDYLVLTPNSGEVTDVDVTFTLADGVKLSDYTETQVVIWLAESGDGIGYHYVELTEEQYVPDGNNAFMKDYTKGVENVEYYYYNPFYENYNGDGSTTKIAFRF